MDIKSFNTKAEALAFMAEIEASGKGCHLVETSFYNVVYNY